MCMWFRSQQPLIARWGYLIKAAIMISYLTSVVKLDQEANQSLISRPDFRPVNENIEFSHWYFSLNVLFFIGFRIIFAHKKTNKHILRLHDIFPLFQYLRFSITESHYSGKTLNFLMIEFVFVSAIMIIKKKATMPSKSVMIITIVFFFNKIWGQ